MSPSTAMKIDVFSEGRTEEGVIGKLCSRAVCSHTMTERGGGGDPAFLDKLRQFLGEWFNLQLDARESVRILVLRDWDKHTGKTIESLCQSVLSIVQRHQPDAELAKHAAHENVFTLRTSLNGLSLALHIANRFYDASFVKATIDDYVLDLALRQTTAQSLLESKRQDGARQQPPRDWQITAEALAKKVWQEVPELLQKNNVPNLLEAKDFLRLYATILQQHTAPAAFAGKVLQHAREEEIREVFAPLLAAIESLAGQP